MGETKFFSYSGYDNNCQSFVLNLLNSNGILTNELCDFIKQNTESIFATNPTLRKLTNNVTDLDGRFHEIIGGDIEKENDNAVSYKTYKVFAKNYKIKLVKPKSIEELANEIHDYEKQNKITNGLYY